MDKMSNLLTGKYFRFFGEKPVYHVEKIIYSGDSKGNFTIYYYNTETNKNFVWRTGDFNSAITIYDN